MISASVYGWPQRKLETLVCCSVTLTRFAMSKCWTQAVVVSVSCIRPSGLVVRHTIGQLRSFCPVFTGYLRTHQLIEKTLLLRQPVRFPLYNSAVIIGLRMPKFAREPLNCIHNCSSILQLWIPRNMQIQRRISFKVVSEGVKEPLMLPKFACFLSAAKQIEPFLVSFQTYSPMVPFLHSDLLKVVSSLMERFLKQQMLKNCRDLIRLYLTRPRQWRKHLWLFKSWRTPRG